MATAIRNPAATPSSPVDHSTTTPEEDSGPGAPRTRGHVPRAIQPPCERGDNRCRAAGAHAGARVARCRGSRPSGFAVEQLSAVRAACSEALGRPVDRDSLPSARDDGREAGGGGWSGFLVGAGCLTVLLGVVGIWSYGLIALVG
ncbi:DUF6584 family protein [Streptomyces pilosus]|uniref:DUF6584 family protein n=1 Tax=Streptomyces pilosus TaxID=28893 RepID=UPI0036FFD71D